VIAGIERLQMTLATHKELKKTRPHQFRSQLLNRDYASASTSLRGDTNLHLIKNSMRYATDNLLQDPDLIESRPLGLRAKIIAVIIVGDDSTIAKTPTYPRQSLTTTDIAEEWIGANARALLPPFDRPSKATALAILESAAQSSNVANFMDAYRASQWDNQSPEVLVRAIRLALQVGAHVAARELAKLGVERYTDDAEIQRLASLFFSNQPGRRIPPDPASAANMEWMMQHTNEYRGQWVAVQGGVLRAAASNLADVLKVTGNLKGTNTLVMMVH